MSSFPDLWAGMSYDQFSRCITGVPLSTEGPLDQTLFCQILTQMPFEIIARMFRERSEEVQVQLSSAVEESTTPLIAAMRNKEARKIAQLLLHKGVNINQRFLINAQKMQALFEYIAAMDPPGRISEEKRIDIVKEVQEMKKKMDGATALWVALKLLELDDKQLSQEERERLNKENIPTIRFLLERGAEVGREDTLSPSERVLLKQLQDEMLYGVEEGKEMAAAFVGEKMAEQFEEEQKTEEWVAAFTQETTVAQFEREQQTEDSDAEEEKEVDKTTDLEKAALLRDPELPNTMAAETLTRAANAGHLRCRL